MNIDKIVTITLNPDAIKPKLPYTVRINAPLSAIKEYALEHPNVYVIVLYMDYEVADDQDWNEALGQKWATRVLSPVWVDNVQEMDLYVNHFLTLDGVSKDDWRCVE